MKGAGSLELLAPCWQCTAPTGHAPSPLLPMGAWAGERHAGSSSQRPWPWARARPASRCLYPLGQLDQIPCLYQLDQTPSLYRLGQPDRSRVCIG